MLQQLAFVRLRLELIDEKNVKKREKKRKRKYKKYKAQFKSSVHFLKNRYIYLSKLPKLQMHPLVQQLKKKQ